MASSGHLTPWESFFGSRCTVNTVHCLHHSSQRWTEWDLRKCCCGLNFPCSTYCVVCLAWLDPDWYRTGTGSEVWLCVDIHPCSWWEVSVFRVQNEMLGCLAGCMELSSQLVLDTSTFSEIPNVNAPFLTVCVSTWWVLWHFWKFGVLPIFLSFHSEAPLPQLDPGCWRVVMPSLPGTVSVSNHKIIPQEDFPLGTGSIGSWIVQQNTTSHLLNFLGPGKS